MCKINKKKSLKYIKENILYIHNIINLNRK